MKFLSRFTLLLMASMLQALPPPLTIEHVSEIRQLSREQAANAIPVRITGVSLWAGMGAVVVDDGDQSVWVECKLASGIPIRKADLHPGSLLVVEGVTDPGGFAPIIIPSSLKKIGTLPIRPPRRVPIERLLSGNEDGQRVEIEGIVQELLYDQINKGSVMMSLISEGHFCRVFTVAGKDLLERDLVDAKIRVRGILAPDHNARAETTNIKILTSNSADVDVLVPPPRDAFQSPYVPLHQLAPFSPESRPWNRKVTSGVVTLAIPGNYFFLQHGDTAIRVQSKSAKIAPGDRVDVAGFVTRYDSIATMKNALVRVVGSSPLPPPIRTSPEALLKIRGNSKNVISHPDPACRKIRISGRIQQIDWLKPDVIKAIWIEDGSTIFPAYLPLAQSLTPDQADSLVPGASAELTGICELKFSGIDTLRRSFAPVAFHLLLSSPSEIRVTHRPSWWTPARMKVALAGVCITLALVLTWTSLLRRQVARQSRIIGEKIAGEAVHAERYRIARDLHDSLEQQLTGVSLHLYGASSSIQSNPGSAENALVIARRMLKHTQRETRNAIRDLRSPILKSLGLVETLRNLAAEMSSASGPGISFEVPEAPLLLTPDAEYQLLRLTQEALCNALKHAGATFITIRIVSNTEHLELSIQDNGCGFKPDALDAANPSHFGMLGMQERASKIGASWSILSAPGLGTTISVSLKTPPP